MGIRPLPRNVTWKERDGKTIVEGKVIAEATVDDSYEHGDFRRVLQIIRKKGEDTDTIRIGYYVKDKGASEDKWHWGSQTTFMTSKASFEKLIEKAKKRGII